MKTRTVLLPGNISMELIQAPAGEFIMGSNEYENESPAHKVTFAKPFWMTKYPVTQEQWVAVMGHNPSSNQNFPNLPVESVSWVDAQEFIKKLNEFTGLQFDLPSEAKWEYCCRAGTTTNYSTGDTITSNQANFNNYYGSTTPVDMFPPNDWGFFDMHGNVWEWCADQYHENYIGAPTDGSAWVDKEEK